MILPVKKIVEEFYCNTSRFKNINQSFVIKYRTNYSIATINCSHLDKKWFFILCHALPTTVNFCKLWCNMDILKNRIDIFSVETSFHQFSNIASSGLKKVFILQYYILFLRISILHEIKQNEKYPYAY